MTKEYVYLLQWDELGGEPKVSNTDAQDNELTIPITCSDEELVIFLRQQNDDEEDPDGAWGTDWLGRPNTYEWRCDGVRRGGNTATVEWRSDRNHLAVTTVIWLD